MFTVNPIPPPNPNDARSIQLHKETVLTGYGPLFDLMNLALRDSVPRATDFFRLLNGPMDLGVHAGNTRYLTRLFLASKDISSENEESLGFELDRVPNCGLCLRGPNYEIRILKASSDGVPRATSDARSRFYSSNQMQFAFVNGQRPDPQQPITLNLVVLWSMDASYSFAGLEIACPRGEQSDGRVDCYWITPWQAGESVPTLRESSSPRPESDLDEIRPLVVPKVASD
jgi:hypothetical protein